MTLDTERTRNYIQNFNFTPLFIEELGWDHHTQQLDVIVGNQTYNLNAISEKRGVVVFICTIGEEIPFPHYSIRRQIETHVAKSVREHIIIFLDYEETRQIWQWVKREPGRPVACREHEYTGGQTGEPLIQKLQSIVFSIEEEEELALPDVTFRVRAGFDIERVTKRFYDVFKKEHAGFLGFIVGIPDEDLQRWYASVMLNRLMFIYFIQKKSFLDNDIYYLSNKLEEMKRKDRNKYYKDFLYPLFFEGFAKKEEERTTEINSFLGEVPFLNGGLFLKHQIEELHENEIQINDEAFEKLYNFFEQYHWHLDDRPLRADNEINPDVLGYIFEKYINQKQMGAYYTREDITEYISKNTILPFIFDQAKKSCKIAFEGDRTIWDYLQNEPDRYIYDAVTHGITVNIHENPIKKLDTALVIPEEISKGIDNVKEREEWNKPAPQEYALPTEIWREVIARRQRYEEIKKKIENGEITEINDFITYNLDIRQFAQDVIENCEGPELLRSLYKAIKSVSVMDPTCGSGAFLFAALNILEPLYEACLDRMQVFIDEMEKSGEKHRPEKYSDFKKYLAEVDKHPNKKYFIFKSIIINNLFGVDIMEEAIEICKLRLFLKLVAQIDDINNIEPLPDIDFNIRAGNTLVGFTSYEDVKNAVTSKLDFKGSMETIEERSEDVDLRFNLFREMQTEHGMKPEEFRNAKIKLNKQLIELEEELNKYLAGEYNIDYRHAEKYLKWKSSHSPFHWFVDFYGIIKKGGFNVIIGNPPYVEYSKVRKEYLIKNFKTINCGNLYAFVLENSLRVLIKKGRCGLIVQLSALSTERMESLQNLIKSNLNINFYSHFSGDRNPAELFTGVKNRLSIILGKKAEQNSKNTYSTNYLKWYTVFRPFLFTKIKYSSINNHIRKSTAPKVGDKTGLKILEKIGNNKNSISSFFSKTVTKYNIVYHNTPIHWIRAFDFLPYFWNERVGEKLSTQMILRYTYNENYQKLLVSIMNSNLFFWFWLIHSDCYHLISREIFNFKIDLDVLEEKNKSEFISICNELMDDYRRRSIIKQAFYKTTGLVKYQEIDPKKSKKIIDRIDLILADHYNFDNEEIDYIINYDIKFRMAFGSS